MRPRSDTYHLVRTHRPLSFVPGLYLGMPTKSGNFAPYIEPNYDRDVWLNPDTRSAAISILTS